MRRHPKAAPGAVVVSLFGSVVANSALVPLMPYVLATRAGWDVWQVGIYSFLVSGTTIVINRWFARKVDRGTPAVALCALGGMSQIAAGAAAAMALRAEWMLAAVVMLLALGGAVVPVFYVLGRRIAEDRGRDPASFSSIMRVATSAGWIVGPGVAFWVLGFTGAQTALALSSVLAAAALLTLSAVKSALRTADVSGSTDASEPSLPVGPMKARPHTTAAVVVVAAFSFAHIVTTLNLALLLVRDMGVHEPSTGLLLAVKAGAEILSILAAPSINRRIRDASMVLLLCSLLGVGAYATYFLADSWWQALVALVLDGSCYGLFVATGLAWFQSLSADAVGVNTGRYMTGIYSGLLIGSPISGLVGNFWLSGITLLSLVTCLSVATGLASQRVKASQRAESGRT